MFEVLDNRQKLDAWPYYKLAVSAYPFMSELRFNPIALRKAKTVCNFPSAIGVNPTNKLVIWRQELS